MIDVQNTACEHEADTRDINELIDLEQRLEYIRRRFAAIKQDRLDAEAAALFRSIRRAREAIEVERKQRLEYLATQQAVDAVQHVKLALDRPAADHYRFRHDPHAITVVIHFAVGTFSQQRPAELLTALPADDPADVAALRELLARKELSAADRREVLRLAVASARAAGIPVADPAVRAFELDVTADPVQIFAKNADGNIVFRTPLPTVPAVRVCATWQPDHMTNERSVWAVIPFKPELAAAGASIAAGHRISPVNLPGIAPRHAERKSLADALGRAVLAGEPAEALAAAMVYWCGDASAFYRMEHGEALQAVFEIAVGWRCEWYTSVMPGAARGS